MSGDLSLPVMLATGILPGLGARRAPGPLWPPSDFFPLSRPGIFLDGSDNSVMWQDALGTVPVVNLGDPVGLVLDKRLWSGKSYAQVMAAQSEIPQNSEFAADANWVKGSGVTITGGAAVFTSVASGVGLSQGTGTAFSTAKHYQVEGEIEDYVSGRLTCRPGAAGSFHTLAEGNGVFRRILLGGGSSETLQLFEAAGNGNYKLKWISVKEIPGNHAYQETSASRPVWQEDDLGARGLLFDGVNDSLVTPAIDFSASDKIMVSMGVRHLAGNSNGTIVELGAAVHTSRPGTFFLRGSAGGLDLYQWSISTATDVYSPTVPAVAPNSAVLALLSDLGQPRTERRKDGQDAGGADRPTGGGNFGDYPLYIGRRAGTSLPFIGFLHQLVIRGGAWPDAAELAQLEAYLASKSKVTL